MVSRNLNLRLVMAAFVLPLFLFVSSLGSEGTLLCLGKDGHVAIELIDACNGSGGGLRLAGMYKSDYCGPCIDVQFPGSPIYTKNVSRYIQTLSLIFSSAVLPPLSLKEYSNKHVNLPEYPHHKTLASLHSVVLLI